MGFDSDDSMKALSASDWDPTRAIDILCDEESPQYTNVLAENVLESAAVQSYLSDPEIFMSKSNLIYRSLHKAVNFWDTWYFYKKIKLDRKKIIFVKLDFPNKKYQVEKLTTRKLIILNILVCLFAS